jgi:hypothetical protein
MILWPTTQIIVRQIHIWLAQYDILMCVKAIESTAMAMMNYLRQNGVEVADKPEVH